MRARRVPLFSSAVAIAAVAAAWPCGADELLVSGSAQGFLIHGPEQTLRENCSTDSGGRLWLELPGGARFELVTSTGDTAIANPGDGSFHTFEEREVRAALAEVRFPLNSVRADVYLLPYPRRAGLESAAGSELILLSPGVRPLTREHQHAELVHELGHVVQYALMPDPDHPRWSRYRELRGIQDPAVYGPASRHADRPHEIFAEDFRALFGGATANYSGSIENASIPPPQDVPGLEGFVLELAGSTAVTSLTSYPNPARGIVRFYRAGSSAVPLDLFDVRGRRVASVAPTQAGSVVQWTWDGRDARGRPLASAILYARTRDGSATTRITRIP
jgi:hypothetical protein